MNWVLGVYILISICFSIHFVRSFPKAKSVYFVGDFSELMLIALCAIGGILWPLALIGGCVLWVSVLVDGIIFNLLHLRRAELKYRKMQKEALIQQKKKGAIT